VSATECLAFARGYAVVAQGGLEPAAVSALVAGEVPAEPEVVFGLGAAQADPPLFAGGIDALRAGALQRFAGQRRLVTVAGLHEEDGPALPQRILVDVKLVFRQSDGGSFLQRRA